MSYPPISEYINSDFGRILISGGRIAGGQSHESSSDFGRIQVLDNFRISLSGCITAPERFPSVDPSVCGVCGEVCGVCGENSGGEFEMETGSIVPATTTTQFTVCGEFP